MAKIKTRPWDPAEHLKTDEDIVAYLEAALEDGDPELIELVLGNIVRARGLKRVGVEALRANETVGLGLAPSNDVPAGTAADALRALRARLEATTLTKLKGALPRVPQPPRGWPPHGCNNPLRYRPA